MPQSLKGRRMKAVNAGGRKASKGKSKAVPGRKAAPGKGKMWFDGPGNQPKRGLPMPVDPSGGRGTRTPPIGPPDVHTMPYQQGPKGAKPKLSGGPRMAPPKPQPPGTRPRPSGPGKPLGPGSSNVDQGQISMRPARSAPKPPQKRY